MALLLVQAIAERLHGVSRQTQLALAAECADRVYPIYEEYWVGTYAETVRRGIDIGWLYACGEPTDAGEIQACLTDVADLTEFYIEDGLDVLIETVTVALRVLQALSGDNNASGIAVGRALVSALGAAQSAEAMTNQRTPKAARVEVAMAEEQAWQDQALLLVLGRRDPPTRDMFEVLGGKPPLWLQDWRLRSKR